ncbi:hypothetical protein DKL61_07195 [Gammaproteobacteria bacterium ESL0073]|nr:hypothetical protein DKL61_07195 [Gammaproteobacteria bacterium ESL0073]
MQIKFVFTITILLSLLMTACNNNSPKQQLMNGPWSGPFGTQMGLTKQQIEQYTTLAEIGTDGQTFAGQEVPNNYGLKFDSVVYSINSVEGLCALSLMTKSDEDIGILRQKIEDVFGKPTIERPGKYVTWDKKNLKPTILIAINYIPNGNVIKVFYPNADRCKLL